ncbi:MAG: hypothetical protein LW860_18490 [Xanthomonadaceae bacterium]|jgi:hypothetical protein|nr:hypothetical protein [Xanthomonadaceae bacterium]
MSDPTSNSAPTPGVVSIVAKAPSFWRAGIQFFAAAATAVKVDELSPAQVELLRHETRPEGMLSIVDGELPDGEVETPAPPIEPGAPSKPAAAKAAAKAAGKARGK